MHRREPIVVAITASAIPNATRAADILNAKLHVRAQLGEHAPGCATFDDTALHIRALFAAGHPIVGICASGILVRALAPLISSKHDEPPVVAMAEDGSSAVPLLGGHRGANDIARQLAEKFDSHAAITTAGDLALGLALDAPPEGWQLENRDDAKAAMAGLLAGRPARISGEADWLAPLEGRATITAAAPNDPIVLSVEGCEPLVYRRQTLMLGVGCARGCDPAELMALAARTLAEHGRSHFEIAQVVSIDVKSDEAAVHALADHFGVSARFYDATTLEAQSNRLANPSEIVFAEVGCHGVAEGAALAAAGAEARLAIEKNKSANATVAAADIVNQVGLIGHPRGRLAVVGIGPGASDWRTPEASRLIAEADELVGYGLYIDLLGGLANSKPRHDFPLGGEEDRCRFALERASEGYNIALVCSGDAGIYAMGALVMELLDRSEDVGGVSAAARRVEVVNAPGVSALQAASARAGALLGHDFCAISLSDLLTPRDDILRRIRAAADGDFVIAFYNPVSKRRRTLLAEARDILLTERPADTPVLLASNLGRADERLTPRTLATLAVDEVDMLTVVLVGSSASRTFASGDVRAGASGTLIYTPRGYAKKLATNDRDHERQ